MEENRDLCSIPSEDDIMNIVWEMNPLKAPGLDGMPSVFYNNYWDIAGPQIVAFVKEFFNSRRFTRAINHTFICIIPKKEYSKSFNHFRPISFYNFCYKIIVKILATRLRRLIDRLISAHQSAFIPRRWIEKYSVMAQEALHTLREKKKR